MSKNSCFLIACLLLLPRRRRGARHQDKGKIVEEVVARVNNEVITRGDLERAQKSLAEDAKQDCPACTAGADQRESCGRGRRICCAT